MEERHNIILLGGIGAVVVGLFVAQQWAKNGSDTGPAPAWAIALPLIVAFLGLTSLIVSRFGTRWRTLGAGQKALVVPGVVAGMTVGIVVVAAVGVLLFLAWAVFEGLNNS
jgi:predicted transporter